jgi:hypothetical protein
MDSLLDNTMSVGSYHTRSKREDVINVKALATLLGYAREMQDVDTMQVDTNGNTVLLG